jgi:hypothetical protein
MSSAVQNFASQLNVRCFDENLAPEHVRKLSLSSEKLDKIGTTTLDNSPLYESKDGKHFIQMDPEQAYLLPDYKPAAFARILDIVSRKVDRKQLQKVDQSYPLVYSAQKYRLFHLLLANACKQEAEATKDLYKIAHPQRFLRLHQGQTLVELFNKAIAK